MSHIVSNRREAHVKRADHVQFVCTHPDLGHDGVGGQGEGLCHEHVLKCS